MFFEQIGSKLETKRKMFKKLSNIKKSDNTLFNNLWVKEETKEKTKAFWTRLKQNISELWYKTAAIPTGKLVLVKASVRKEGILKSMTSVSILGNF